MGSMRWRYLRVIGLLALVMALSAERSHAAAMSGVVDDFLGKFKNAGNLWEGTLKHAANGLFWILATISLSWTCISMAVKQADMGELFAELCRYIMFTGFFYWLLLNGATFANDIVASLWTVGGQASTGGMATISPGMIVNLAMAVFQSTIQHVNFLQPESVVVPVIIALIILIVCALIAVNMILLLCSAWIVLYAGIIFLGFGGCRWTSDMAINYYRTALGIAVSLMTMQLIIGLGTQYLQKLLTAAGTTPDAPTLAALMVASIILLVVAHRIPQMVAGMVVGGGHNGAIGGVGVMTLLGTAIAASSLARTAAATSGAGAASEAATASYKLLMDRIQAAEAAIAAGSGNGGSVAPLAGAAGSTTTSSSLGGGLTGGAAGRGPASSNRPASRTSTSRVTASAAFSGGTNISTASATTNAPQSQEEPEAPLTRPMTPDEQRGFPPPTDPPEWENRV
jgi:type IV secretion system protein TrbL